jgi:hypothetical protein
MGLPAPLMTLLQSQVLSRLGALPLLDSTRWCRKSNTQQHGTTRMLPSFVRVHCPYP